MTRSCRHLSQCGVSHIMKHVRCVREKVTCEVHSSTHPVGHSRLPSAVNETYCNKQKNELNCPHELHQLLDVSQFHQESLEEECHLRYG